MSDQARAPREGGVACARMEGYVVAHKPWRGERIAICSAPAAPAGPQIIQVELAVVVEVEARADGLQEA